MIVQNIITYAENKVKEEHANKNNILGLEIIFIIQDIKRYCT